MSRIFKNSTFKMQLLVADDINTSIDGLSFKFHTTDPNIYVEVFDNYTLKANIAILTIGSTLFSALDEGVLTYEVRGYFNGEYVTIERQSNYFLKYSNSIPQVNLQEKTIGFIGNGYYEIYPDEGYNGMSKVNVHVDTPAQGGGSCNLGPLNADFEDRLDGTCWWYAEEQGLDGFNYVSINASVYGNEKYNQGFVDGQNAGGGGTGDGGSCKLTTLEVTENGTYTPPTTPVLVFDGDDMFDFAYADTPNAIEIRFKVNDSGWIFGNEKVGLFAESTDVILVYWFGYEGRYGINNGEVNTIVIKPYDSLPIILNGGGISMHEREIDNTDTTEILLGNGNFDFYYAKFWSEYSEYNNEQTPLFYYLPNTDGNIKKSLLGGDFEVMNNRGGGICQYTEISEFDGFSRVHVNVETTTEGGGGTGGGGSCKLQDRWMTPNFDNIINDNLLIVSPVDDENGPYDGMSRVVITRTEASAPNLMYGVYRAVYDDALSQGETILSHMSNYINENNGSLNGFFDNGEFINVDWKRHMAFTLEQGWYDSRLTDMSYMYNGDGIVPITAFYGFNCENTETIEGAFNGWTKLHALEKLFMLGNSFRQEQTLDLSMTNLNNNPNTKCLIKELYDFKYGGHNQYDVTTSYIKGLSNFRQDIEERGWQCID